jgi:hypothetical protein
VDSARAGENAKIRLDSSSAVLVENKTSKSNKEDKGMSLKKMNLDGVEYEAEAAVIAHATKETQRADEAEKIVTTLKADNSTLEAERDTLKAKLDQIEKELETVKNESVSQEKIDSAVQAKIKLLSSAEKAGVEVKADMKDEDIQKAVIVSVMPSANLDGKDPVYISARFDSAIEMLEERTKNNTDQLKVLHSDSRGEKREDSETEARKRYLDSFKK